MTEKEIEGIQKIRQHIQGVGNCLILLCNELMRRAITHDASRFTIEELEASLKAQEEGHNLKFNTEEYHKWRESYKGLVDIHNRNNPHHPEHHKHGVNDMDLIDLLEMLCDWCDKAEDIEGSIDINAERLNICPQLSRILKNTVCNVDGLGKEIKAESKHGKTQAKRTLVFYEGERYGCKSYWECWIKFCEILSERYSDRFEEVLTLDLGQRRSGGYFSRNPEDLTASHKIGRTDIYVHCYFDSDEIKKIIGRLNKHFGCKSSIE